MKKIFLITFSIVPFLSQGQNEIRIPLPPSGYGWWYPKKDTSNKRFVELCNDTTMYHLMDEQTSYDPRNKAKYVPTTQPHVQDNPNESFPLTGVIDFGTTYNIRQIYYYDAQGADSAWIFDGKPYHWHLLKAFYTGTFNTNDSILVNDTTEYLEIILKSEGTNINEFALYGFKIGGAPPPTVPQDNFVYHARTFGQSDGVVAWEENQQPPSIFPKYIGYHKRIYEHGSYMDTNTVTHSLSAMHYNVDRAGGGDLHYYFPNLINGMQEYIFPSVGLDSLYEIEKLQGQQLFMTTQPPWWPNQAGARPIDSTAVPAIHLFSTDPLAYARVGAMQFQVAGVLGNGSLSSSYSQVTFPFGFWNTGVAQVFEYYNEQDANWLGYPKTWMGMELAAFDREVYDGDGQLVSARQGIKTADPSAFVLHGGTWWMDSVTYAEDGYMADYDTNAVGVVDHVLSFNAVNFHYYPSSGSEGTGLTPEEDCTYFKIKAFVQWCRDEWPGVPGKDSMQVWLTETGWDRHHGTRNSAPLIAGVDSASAVNEQARLLIREELILPFSGISAWTYYSERNDAIGGLNWYPTMSKTLQALSDSAGKYTFNTVGFTTEYGNPFDFFTYPEYYYQYGLDSLLYNYKPDSMIHYGLSDSLEIVRYVSLTNPDSVIYAIWNGTKTNKITSRYTITLTGVVAGQALQIVQMANNSLTGNIANATADGSGKFTLTVSENPIFISVLTGGSAPPQTVLNARINSNIIRN